MPELQSFRPAKNLLWRIALWAMGGPFVLLLAVPILIVIGMVRGTCWDEQTDSTSPDSKLIARSVVRTCQHFGPDVMITQFIELTSVDGGGGAKVFQSNMGGSALAHWSDNQHLDIAIGGKSGIDLSLHDSDGVHITYYVSGRLMNHSFSGAFSDTNIDIEHQSGRLSDADYEFMKKGNKHWREWEENFFRWASQNATIVQD